MRQSNEHSNKITPNFDYSSRIVNYLKLDKLRAVKNVPNGKLTSDVNNKNTYVPGKLTSDVSRKKTYA